MNWQGLPLSLNVIDKRKKSAIDFIYGTDNYGYSQTDIARPSEAYTEENMIGSADELPQDVIELRKKYKAARPSWWDSLTK